jgi:hypothetical protein
MAEIHYVSLPAGSRKVSVSSDGQDMIVEFRVPRSQLLEKMQDAQARIGRGRRPGT